jgi:hypothetical protein
MRRSWEPSTRLRVTTGFQQVDECSCRNIIQIVLEESECRNLTHSTKCRNVPAGTLWKTWRLLISRDGIITLILMFCSTLMVEVGILCAGARA